MKTRLTHLFLVWGFAALFATSAVWAVESGNNGDVEKAVENEVLSEEELSSDDDADELSMSSVDNKQININNQHEDNENVSHTSDSFVGNENTGNVGANNATGDFNQQANEAILATVDAEFVFVNTEAVTFQDIGFNKTFSHRTNNNATLEVSNNTGNVGANNVAGTGNQQKNRLIVAVADSIVLAETTSSMEQTIDDNKVGNDFSDNFASLTVGNNTGNVGVNNAAGINNQQINTLQLAVDRSGVGVSELVQ